MSETSTTPHSYVMNAYIYYKATAKAPVFEVFQNLCKMENSETIDYADVEWRYFQFYHGCRDFHLKRSDKDLSPKTFADLPDDVLLTVLRKLDLIDRLILRKVSHHLRYLVDDSRVSCEKIRICLENDLRQFVLERTWIDYKKKSTRSLERRVCDKGLKSYKIYSYESDATKMMMRDIKTVLDNPKLDIGNLEVCFNADYHSTDKFVALLESLKYRIRVKRLTLLSYDRRTVIPSIIQHINPETFEELDLDGFWENMTEFGELVESDQWNKAIEFRCTSLPAHFPFEKMMHFKTIMFKGASNNHGEEIAQIRDVILKSSHLEKAVMYFMVAHPFDIDSILSSDDLYDGRTSRFLIPNSHKYFQLEFFRRRNHIKLTINRTWEGRRYADDLDDWLYFDDSDDSDDSDGSDGSDGSEDSDGSDDSDGSNGSGDDGDAEN